MSKCEQSKKTNQKSSINILNMNKHINKMFDSQYDRL